MNFTTLKPGTKYVLGNEFKIVKRNATPFWKNILSEMIPYNNIQKNC